MKAKRWISFLIALTMAVSLLGGLCPTASAVEWEMPTIEISGVQAEAVIGEAAVSGDAVVPEGAGYTANYWWETDQRFYYDADEDVFYGDYRYVSDGEIFENGKDYALCIDIELDADWEGWESYVAGENLDVVIIVNGGEQVWYSTLLSVNVENGISWIYYSEVFCFSQEITAVELFDVPKAVPGEVASTDGIRLPENAPYSIVCAQWKNMDVSVEDSINGQIFEGGVRYRLDVEIVPAEGYHFADDCVIYADGEEIHNGSPEPWYASPNFGEEYAKIMIDTVEISYTVEPPVAGEMPLDVNIVTPEDANYYAWSSWYKFNSEEGYWESLRCYDEFEEGEEYIFGITIDPYGGYGFTEDVVVISNGTVLGADAYYNEDGWRLSVDEYFVAEATEPTESIVIDSVMISDLQAPVAGEPLDDSVTVLTEGCTAELNWSVYDGADFLPVAGTAEKGMEYCLDIILTASEGYSFAEEIQIWLDDEQDWAYSWGDRDTAEVSLWYDTCEVIESIAITSTDKGELGAAASADGVSAPEGANYTVSAYWGVLNMEEGLVPFEGVFADNTVYAYTVNAEPAEGYKFAEELTVTYNGEPVSEDFLFYDSSSLEVVGEVFTGTMQKVRKVEINTRFKAGMKASDAVVEVPEDAPYEITEYYWVDMETGDELTGKFVAGKQYGLMAYVAPKAGYVIDMAAQTAVNGTDDYELMQSQYAYLYGAAAVVLDCETEDTNGNPSTGDDSVIVLLWVFTLLSAIGLVSVLLTKKREYK